jgi:RNA polymerase sigma-70 factor (ECF subfamily)
VSGGRPPAQPHPDNPLLPNDADLLRSHVDGDPDAFATLVARHADRLWAVALATMRNPEDAADALQDAYLSAFRRADSFRGEAQVTTWLHRVVVNACLDRLRALKVRAAEPLPEDLDRDPDLGVTPDDPVLASQQRRDVVRALSQLNPDQRAALVLVDMQGYSVEEAALVLGCAPGTVKSRCARGRARLVPLLADLAPTAGGKH